MSSCTSEREGVVVMYYIFCVLSELSCQLLKGEWGMMGWLVVCSQFSSPFLSLSFYGPRPA